MMGKKFISKKEIIDLGEIIAAVYICDKYETNKAIQFMKWNGMRTDMMYRIRNTNVIIFYQDKQFVPKISVEEEFYREIQELDMWINMPDSQKYDMVSREMLGGFMCVSFRDIVNAIADKEAE